MHKQQQLLGDAFAIHRTAGRFAGVEVVGIFVCMLQLLGIAHLSPRVLGHQQWLTEHSTCMRAPAVAAACHGAHALPLLVAHSTDHWYWDSR